MKHTVIQADDNYYLTMIKACKGARVNYNNVKHLKFPFEHNGIIFRRLNVEEIAKNIKTKERTLTLENGIKVKL